ncbi:RNA polymerase subunit sigma-24 [Paraburkholderia lacunae]|uniref:RNA polymerase sigma factor n=2 Tax=Paraburkholderia lacunae TaxID=2211104 RepID=A0A370NAR7_9BURK|nr:RNA polymerase subunit sigma-24 [Paraburkholderia lacunae]
MRWRGLQHALVSTGRSAAKLPLFPIMYGQPAENAMPMQGHAAAAGDGMTDDFEARRRDELNRLLLRTGEGDQAAFATLYQRTSAKLFGICVKMLRDRSEAEDVLQDVYVTVWRRAAIFDPGMAGAVTWLATIARNRAIDRLRSRREESLDESTEEDLVDEHPSPAAIAERSQQSRRLEHCLERLPAEHGKIIREAFFTGATYAELAERLSVPLGTMKSWIRRSLIQLRACLEQ